ncbi:MAG: extracellular solute-binding protein [Propionibacteriaceae bacterium]|jgi:multiple sugar transport system substrate-binding protein|nr:extracellular solute-binding protein [Propionibacteriaceae bacterium]
MRTNKRAAGFAGLALALSLTLAGCGSSSDDGSGDSTTDDGSGGDVTLEMSWWGDDTRAALFAEVIDLFEAANPGITVTETPVGSPDDLFNRLATDFASGGETAPDVFALGGAKPQEYGDAGALLDLDTVADIAEISKYPEFSLTNAMVNDKLYGLPTGGNATAAFVNTDILAQAGITVPTDAWTWDDFVTMANQVGSAGLTNAQGQPIYGVDLRIQDIMGTYTGQMTEFGMYTWEGTLGVTADDIASWYDIEVKLRDGGGLPDPTIVTAGWNLPPDQQLYTLGQAAFTFGYSNLIATYAGGGETIMLTPPTNTDKTGVSLLPSAFWSINAATAHPEEAAKLMSWFLNEPAAAELILDTRGVPFNPDIAAVVSPLLTGPSQQAAEYVEVVLDSGEVAPPQPNGGANMNKYCQDGESDVLFGSKTPQEAGADWVAKLGADLEG